MATTWKSSDTSKATVDNTGLVTGVAVGTTNITATVDGVTSPPLPLTVTAKPQG